MTELIGWILVVFGIVLTVGSAFFAWLGYKFFTELTPDNKTKK